VALVAAKAAKAIAQQVLERYNSAEYTGRILVDSL